MLSLRFINRAGNDAGHRRHHTEIEANETLFDVNATFVAAGGVCGAEGAVWIAVDGKPDKPDVAKKVLNQIEKGEPFQIV